MTRKKPTSKINRLNAYVCLDADCKKDTMVLASSSKSALEIFEDYHKVPAEYITLHNKTCVLIEAPRETCE